MALLLLVALILVIALPAALLKQPGPSAPSFLFEPQLLSATNASLEFRAGVSKAAVVHYVLLPRTGDASAGWGKMSASDVQLSSQGMGWSHWEVRSGACQHLRKAKVTLFQCALLDRCPQR